MPNRRQLEQKRVHVIKSIRGARENSVSNESRRTHKTQNSMHLLILENGAPKRIKMQKTKSLNKLAVGHADRYNMVIRDQEVDIRKDQHDMIQYRAESLPSQEMNSLDRSVPRTQMDVEPRLAKETARFESVYRPDRSGSSSLPRLIRPFDEARSRGIKQSRKLSTQRADQTNVLKKMRRSLSRKQPSLPESTLTNQ